MIRLDIDPIESKPFNSNFEQTFIIGYCGGLTIQFNDVNQTEISFDIGGDGFLRNDCVKQAQSIIDGICEELVDFSATLNGELKNNEQKND